MKEKTIVKNRLIVYLISICSIIALIVGIFLIIFSLNIKTIKEIAILTYNEKSNLDYNVYLKPNDYFKEPYLEKGNQYIASIIDYVDVFFDYSFSSSKDIDATFNYKIVATLTVNYNVAADSEKQIWSSDYVLKEDTVSKIEGENSFNITENVKIDYQKYNDIINNFKKDYMLSVTSNLQVKLLIEIDGNYVPIEKVFNEQSNIVLTIPLSQQTIDIKMDYKDIDNNEVINEEEVGNFSNIFYFIIGICLTLISLAIITLFIIKIIKDDKKQSRYIKELRKVLHDFSDLIVEVKKAPLIPKNNASEVKNFEELIDAQLEVRSPIIFAEISKNEEGLFILHDKNYCYYYRLKAKDLDNK